jgi:hypothetical protein
MQIYDPTVSAAKRKALRAPPLARLDGARIGVLANGKLNADAMLQEVAALFVERHGCVMRPLASKTNASAPARPESLVAVAQDADFVITGLGD